MNHIKLNEEALEAARKAAYPHTTPDFKAYSGETMVELEREELTEPIEAYLSHPSALRSIIEQSIKPLEWVKSDSDYLETRGLLGLGTYIIRKLGEASFVAGRYQRDQLVPLSWSPDNTVEAAKAACQRHHTKQVLKLFNFEEGKVA